MAVNQVSDTGVIFEVRKRLRSQLLAIDQYMLMLIFSLIGLVVALTILSDVFFSLENILNVLRQASILGIIATGVTIVMIGGGLDLSVGAVVALTGTVIAVVMVSTGNVALGLFAGIAVGAAVGLFNGIVATRLRVPPFIGTLGTLVLCRGLALVVTGGTTIFNLPRDFGFLGAGSIGLIPVPAIILIVVLIAAYVLLHRMSFGLKVFIIGGNAEAARLAGINVNRISIITYIICGVAASIAGIILAARTRAGDPTTGNFLELFGVAAMVLGGGSLGGGKGSVIGTLAGVLLLGFLQNGLNLMAVPFYWQQLVIGSVFIAAASLSALRLKAN